MHIYWEDMSLGWVEVDVSEPSKWEDEVTSGLMGLQPFLITSVSVTPK